MTSGKGLSLYMTMPDMLRTGHRMKVEDFECNPGGIVGDKNYEDPNAAPILLVSQKSYEIIDEAELILDKGVLMENIYVDIDLNHLKEGTIIEIGDTLFEVNGPCKAFAPAFTALQAEFKNKRVIFTKLNVDHHQDIAQQFGVSGIPTTIFIKGKKLVHRQVGMMPKAQFGSLIDDIIRKSSK